MGIFDSLRKAIDDLDMNARTELGNIKKEILSGFPGFKMPVVSTNMASYPPPPDNQTDIFSKWHISISFGKSSSENYQKAIALAKMAPEYHEQFDSGKILHQAIYSANPKEYLAFIMLYELISTWKSTFVISNGQFIDRKIVGQLNYCYGDKCRSGNPKFCYGASYMTENPFGCHRLQVSACNNPWWSFYYQSGYNWILDKQAIVERLNSYANIYCICPAFNVESIIKGLDTLPTVLTKQQLQRLLQEKARSINLTL